jgi:prolipoprotein diacylglyceryl transferase
MTRFLASFPSPSQGVWHLGWLPIRAYALFIIIGIIVALVIGDRRWVARGGEQGVVYDIALWAVPFGLVGGRLYHLMTDWKTYFGDDGAGFVAALKIWDGGLGIWGAVALGGVGAWIGCRQRGIPLPAFGDAIAPGIVLAQAIGRLGNYFNQELYGRATNVPWGLKVYERRDPNGQIDYLNGVSTGHVDKIVQPTFLYELIWNVLVFVFLIYADRRFKLGHGRLFALYVAAYCVGRFWVELLRDDTATHIAGIRINSFTSMFVFIGAVVYIILAPKGREDPAALAGKPREPKKAKPKAVKTKEEVPQEAETSEDSALVAWTKDLAAVAATSGVVAGVAVAVDDEDGGEPAADRAADGEEPDSAAGEAVGAEEAHEEAAPAEAAAEDEAAPAEAAAEDEAAPAQEADEAEPEAAEVEAEEPTAADEAAEAEDAEPPDEEGEEARAAEPEAESGPEVPTMTVTAESVAAVEPDSEEAAQTDEAAEEPEGEAESVVAQGAPTEEVVDEAEAAGEPEPQVEDGDDGRDAEEGEEAEEGEKAEAAPTPDSAGESSEERVDEVEAPESPEVPVGQAADEATPVPAHDAAAAAGTQGRRWSLSRFRNPRT